MEKFKKVILVLGPIVLIVGLYFTFAGQKNPIPGTIELVNVVTGQVESVAQSRLGMIPALDASGKPVLYPIAKEADGKRVLGERYRPDLLSRIKSKELKQEEIKIDLKTFIVP